MIISIVNGDKGNISSMVLAKILRTCMNLGMHSGGKFRGCTQLLTLWIHNYFPGEEDQRRNDKYERTAWNTEADLIKYFSKPARAETSEEEWYGLFNEIDLAAIKWRVPWLRGVDKYIVPPIESMSLPLFGLFGSVGYTPDLVVRLLGMSTGFPSTTSEIITTEIARWKSRVT